MRKIIQTIKLRKLKTEVNKDFVEKAEVEETIKDLQDETNVDRENSIKNERSSIKRK